MKIRKASIETIRPRSQLNKKRKEPSKSTNENFNEDDKEEAKDTVSDIASTPKISLSPRISGRFRKINIDYSNLDNIAEVS